MKYHILFKFLAIVLCACALGACVTSALSIYALAECGLYEDTTPGELYAEQRELELTTYVRLITVQYAGKNLGNCPEDLLDRYLDDHFSSDRRINLDSLGYTLTDASGKVLAAQNTLAAGLESYTYSYSPHYPVVIGYSLGDRENTPTTNPTTEDYPQSTIPPVSDEYIPDTIRPAPGGANYLYVENYFLRDDQGRGHRYEVGIVQGPEYTVVLSLEPGEMLLTADWMYQVLELGYRHRYTLVWLLVGSLLVFALCATYLCCAAGRKPRCSEVQPGGFNRLPLDLYALVGGWLVVFFAFLIFEGLVWQSSKLPWIAVVLAGLLGLFGCVVIVGFCFACAAQLKMPNWYFLRHSLMGGAVLLLWKWGKSAVSFCFRALHRLWSLLPVMWQWLLTGFALLIVLLVGLAAKGQVLLLSLLLCVLTVAYGAYCFGTLLKRTKDMRQGDLNAKIDDRYLIGSFREHAQNLNALADVVVEAAKNQMRSERMKAELVTNVSHDIKTPLTSIINYVDLLQKAESQDQAAEYVQVLDRQSQRLKKLIDDLMEMSKASTGNMAVELQAVDPVEAINQALGEFSEKLENASLHPIFTAPDTPVRIRADGRLVWRVLSNLLSNAVKYALPGTRLYIDLSLLNDAVAVSLKNISREPLNVEAQELLERFVRGDASRNTEGSGLGLNIAKSLMELQGGSLQLLVDGDLFKVTLLFPRS